MRDLTRLKFGKLKLEVLRKYSNSCVPYCHCCGNSILEFLVIDHINGDGAKHRREIAGKNSRSCGGTAFYRWLKNHNFPVGFRVLCQNCNSSLGAYGYCPHQKVENIPDKVLNSVAKALYKIRNVLYTREFCNIISLLTMHRSFTTGVGKAGLAAHKMASTLSSNGTPSTYIHATELLHGDLGSIQPDDLIIAFSNSGKTDQIFEISEKARDMGVTFILITGDGNGKIAKNAKIILDYGIIEESCSLNLTPTTSTVVQLVISDALAMAVQAKKGLTYENYSKFHGCGYLGQIARLKAKLNKPTNLIS